WLFLSIRPILNRKYCIFILIDQTIKKPNIKLGFLLLFNFYRITVFRANMTSPIIRRINTRTIFGNSIVHFILFLIIDKFFIFEILRFTIVVKVQRLFFIYHGDPSLI